MRNPRFKNRMGLAVLPCLSLSLTPIAAFAQDVINFNELVISAGQTPAASHLTGSAHTVIDAEQIKDSGIVYAADILRRVPGVTVSRSGGSGALTQVRIRGAEANHTLVLIDGIEMNTPGNGEFDFSSLLAADIERIEVIRGAQSGIYGSNAHSGVVNIITRSGRGEDGFSSRAFVELGSFHSTYAGGGVSGAAGPFDMAFTVAINDTEGFNVAPTGSEDDGSFNRTVSGKVGADLNEHLRIESVFRIVDRNNEFDNQFGAFLTDAKNETEGRDVAGRFAFLGEFLDGALTNKAQFTTNHTTLQTFFGNPALFFGSDDRRTGYSWQTDYRFSTDALGGTDHTISGFIEHETQEFSQNGPFAAPLPAIPRQRELTGIAGEYRMEFGETSSLSGAIRHDSNDAFDDATTWRLTGSHLMTQSDTRLHASVGRGVTNPTMIEQFGFFPPFVGNPSLVPESSVSWDAGVEQAFLDGALVVDVTYFSAVLEDEIVTRFIGGASTPINLFGESTRHGVEVSTTWMPTPDWEFIGSYTYMKSEEPTGIAEIRRPEHQASFTATRIFADGRARASVNAIYNGEMPDTVFTFPVAGRVILDDFLVVDVSASYQVRDGIEIYGRVENLLDEDYQEIFSFETAGVAAYAGVRIGLGLSQ